MNELTCDNVCQAAMAMFDGAPCELNPAAIDAHVAACPACSEEIEHLKSLATLLSRQKRREQSADLWPWIHSELNRRDSVGSESSGWFVFGLLTALLIVYKVVEIIPQVEFGSLFKLIPLLIVIGVFRYLRENPFKVNPTLTLEGE